MRSLCDDGVLVGSSAHMRASAGRDDLRNEIYSNTGLSSYSTISDPIYNLSWKTESYRSATVGDIPTGSLTVNALNATLNRIIMG